MRRTEITTTAIQNVASCYCCCCCRPIWSLLCSRSFVRSLLLLLFSLLSARFVGWLAGCRSRLLRSTSKCTRFEALRWAAVARSWRLERRQQQQPQRSATSVSQRGEASETLRNALLRPNLAFHFEYFIQIRLLRSSADCGRENSKLTR